MFPSLLNFNSSQVLSIPSPISSYLKYSRTHLKIGAVVAAVILAFMGQMTYWLLRHQWTKKIFIEKKPEEKTIKMKEKIGDKQKKITEQTLSPDFKKFSLPEINYRKVFNNLTLETEKLKITYLFQPKNEEEEKNLVSCRFSNVYCPKDSRVKVSREKVNEPAKCDDLYLHGNKVKLQNYSFIATQYPLKDQIPLFWEACQNVSLIIDLTNDQDSGITCHYAPIEQQETKDDENFHVTCTHKELKESLNSYVYQYEVKEKSDQIPLSSVKEENEKIPYEVARLHYKHWNDHQGVLKEKLAELAEIVALIEQYQKAQPNKTILIHCRAGVGRTGTAIVAYILFQLIKQGKINASNLEETLFQLILEGRKQRGEIFVQSIEQLKTLWMWGCKVLEEHQQKKIV